MALVKAAGKDKKNTQRVDILNVLIISTKLM